MGAAVPAARLGALSLLCHAGGTVIGGGDGTITLFDAACRDYAQTELRGGVVAMSFSPDRTEVGYVKSTGVSSHFKQQRDDKQQKEDGTASG